MERLVIVLYVGRYFSAMTLGGICLSSKRLSACRLTQIVASARETRAGGRSLTRKVDHAIVAIDMRDEAGATRANLTRLQD
jgi:hypothetical protein